MDIIKHKYPISFKTNFHYKHIPILPKCNNIINPKPSFLSTTSKQHIRLLIQQVLPFHMNISRNI